MPVFAANLARSSKPADTFIHFFSKEPNAFWLDRESNVDSPFSVFGAGKPISGSLEKLPLAANELNAELDLDVPFDFRPGLVGVIEYEGATRFLQVDRALVLDHRAKRIYGIGIFDDQTEFDKWCHAILLRLALIGGDAEAFLHSIPEGAVTSAKVRHSNEQYLNMIEKAQQKIAAGEIYQICLTNEIQLEAKQTPLAVFLALRKKNAAPYAAYFRSGALEVVCSSPEQFIRVSSTGRVSSKPIKGTRPRGENKAQDLAAADELQNNAKERAENLMIVDLMRNDLGRVAVSDSVTVPKLFEVESYATVHQLVSTVQAQLADGFSSVDAILSAFPGGSMTGAPKIRAMQIIEELEAGKRGVYSGVIGYLGCDGSIDLGMTIRSVVFEGGKASIGVGGGITIDSDPQAELAETKLKAKALLTVLNAPDPWA